MNLYGYMLNDPANAFDPRSEDLVADISNGNVVEHMSYDEFRNASESLTSPPTGYLAIPFGFGGRPYYPDTGLVRFGARDYDASVGRWTTKEPIRFLGGQGAFRSARSARTLWSSVAVPSMKVLTL